MAAISLSIKRGVDRFKISDFAVGTNAAAVVPRTSTADIAHGELGKGGG